LSIETDFIDCFPVFKKWKPECHVLDHRPIFLLLREYLYLFNEFICQFLFLYLSQFVINFSKFQDKPEYPVPCNLLIIDAGDSRLDLCQAFLKGCTDNILVFTYRYLACYNHL
jgi:hypothetical protein